MTARLWPWAALGLLFSGSAFGQKLPARPAVAKEITVSTSYTLEAICALMNQISPEFLPDSAANPFLFERTRLMRRNYTHFKAYAQHPAVEATRKMSFNLGTGVYLLALYYRLEAGLAPVGPVSPLLLEAVHPNADSARVQLAAYLGLVDQFAKEAKLAGFMQRYGAVYRQARRELSQHLPHGPFINSLEEYYGEQKEAYTVLVMPFFKDQWGMGWQTGAKTGSDHCYAIVSPFGPQTWAAGDSASACGYASRADAQNWCVHEFGHSFVNPYTALPENQKALMAYSGLFRPIEGQGQYNDWVTVFNEHVVRAGEILVAELSSDKAEADRIRASNKAWMYLPFFEREMRRYLAHRKRYPTFRVFLPSLIASLSALEAEQGQKK